MKLTTKVFFIGFAFVLILAGIFFTVDYLVNNASSNIQTIFVPLVSGAPDLNNPGSESFWSSASSYKVYLEPSLAFTGSTAGKTSIVTVKMAWINSPTPELVALLSFANVGSGPSYSNNPPLINFSGKITPLIPNPSCSYNITGNSTSCFGGFYPQDVGNFPLYYNSSYNYPEQASIWWGLAPGANTTTFFEVSYKPKMVLGTSGTLGTGSGGAAEIWTWSSNPTDNSSNDKGYPGIFFANGTAVYPQNFGMPTDESYAIDGYTNGSSYFQIGGIPPRSIIPVANTLAAMNFTNSHIASSSLFNPFEVQAHGVYSSSSNSWKVEFVRPLITSANLGENTLQEQFNPNVGQTYYVAFSVTQGNAGEAFLQYYNSVSFWWQLRLQRGSGLGYSVSTNYSGDDGLSFLLSTFTVVALPAAQEAGKKR
jgi:hypothetical protein